MPYTLAVDDQRAIAIIPFNNHSKSTVCQYGRQDGGDLFYVESTLTLGVNTYLGYTACIVKFGLFLGVDAVSGTAAAVFYGLLNTSC
jgi:hypothetical protein